MQRLKSNRSLIYAVVALLTMGIIALGVSMLRQKVDSDHITSTSDISEVIATLLGQLDGWPGYGPIASDMLQNRLRSKGIALEWVSDGGVYADRIQALKKGDIDLAVITVGAHQLNRIRDELVGVEVMVIDESHGGDATLAWKDCGIEKVTDLNVKPAYSSEHPDGWTMTFLTDSPSHQQVRTIGKDFGVDALLAKEKPWLKVPNDDRHAFELFRDKKVCVITTWEPWRSILKELSGVLEVYSSDQVDKDIVDVLLVRRELLDRDNPKYAALETMIDEYFSVLKEMRADEGLMLAQMRKFLREYAGLKKVTDDEIRSMVAGVKWINLRDNAENWYGLGGRKYYGLLETHEFARSVIQADEEHHGHLRGYNFLPNISSNIIRQLYLMGGYTEKSDKTTVTDSLTKPFRQLSKEQWGALNVLGELQAKPIIFSSGMKQLDERSQGFIAEVMDELKRYPDFWVELTPGYRTVGDVKARQREARERAQVVQQYVIDQFGVSPNRLRIYVPEPSLVAKVIPRRMNESTRTYGGRLRQVHFVLKTIPR